MASPAFTGFYPVPSAGGSVGLWMTIDPIVFELGCGGSGAVVEIPSGFLTDLASIPPVLRGLFNPWAPDTAMAATIHDWLLCSGFDARVAAGEFYRRLKADQVPLWKRVVYYAAVVANSDRW